MTVLERVVLFPLNGYINRLQAYVSADLIAREFGSELVVAWEQERVAPAEVQDILDLEATNATFIDASMAQERGWDRHQIPVGITQAGPGRVLLAGGMGGEQVLMPQLARMIRDGEVSELVIAAGGKFTLHGDASLTPAQAVMFRNERCTSYATLRLNHEIEDQAERAIASRGRPFLGLHLRYSDRNAQAPSRYMIKNALRLALASTGQDVFIASDSRDVIGYWSTWITRRGAQCWNIQSQSPRSHSRGAIDALIDWRILGHSDAVIYFAESSFGEEAAVATGHFDESHALPASAIRSRAVALSEFTRSAVTYPARRANRGHRSL